MPIHRLTATQVLNLKKPGYHSDGGNLLLLIQKTGAKSWCFRYRRRDGSGRQREAGLGPYPTISLAEARDRAAAMRRKLLDGIDPLDDRREREAAAARERARKITLSTAVDTFIALKSPQWTRQRKNDVARRFSKATAALGSRMVSTITQGDILKLLEPIWTTTPSQAHYLQEELALLFDFCRARDYYEGDNPASWDRLKFALPKKVLGGHHPSMDYRDLPAFMVKLRAINGTVARALELTILCGNRAGETCGALWEEINLRERLWSIPPSRMKARRLHRIPLSDRCVEIFEALPRKCPLVFPSPWDPTHRRPIDRDLLNDLLHGELGASCVTHGFRSTFRSWIADCTTFPRELGELALAHALPTQLEQIYQRSDMLQRRAAMMESWAAFLASPPAADDGKIVALRAK